MSFLDAVYAALAIFLGVRLYLLLGWCTCYLKLRCMYDCLDTALLPSPEDVRIEGYEMQTPPSKRSVDAFVNQFPRFETDVDEDSVQFDR